MAKINADEYFLCVGYNDHLAKDLHLDCIVDWDYRIFQRRSDDRVPHKQGHNQDDSRRGNS